MAEETATTPPQTRPAAGHEMQGGAYEVLRERLAGQCRELRDRVEALNAKRKDVFGGLETKLAGSARIATEHACVPRDMIHLGRKLIFGYEVFLGLKKETTLADVLGVYDFDGAEFHAQGLDFLADDQFQRDVKELFRYFRAARLLQLRNTGRQLLFAFQAGQTENDLKIFRWNIQPDGSAKYLDARGERDYVFPPQQDFEWTRTTREMHVTGRHPHITVRDLVFVECVGGDLTVKIENNTESGQGIYAEPVDDPDQSLDDAEVLFAVLENLVLLKIRPFGENAWRYIVFNRLTQEARRIDAIGQCCIQLPEGHGLIFPGGYYLQTGEGKEFDAAADDMKFQKCVKSPNGEDVLYVFHHRIDGRYILLPYNLIEKRAANPIVCQGFSRFEDGKLVVFRNADNEPARSHPVQIWQTPFTGEGFESPRKSDSHLAKVGNRDLVNGISEMLSLSRQGQSALKTLEAFEQLLRTAQAILDRYHWLTHDECGKLDETVKGIRDTGDAAIGEFEKVRAIRRDTAQKVETFAEELQKIFGRLVNATLEGIEGHVAPLAELRAKRGHLIGLRDLRYADLGRLDALEKELVALYDQIAEKAVAFLLAPEALAPYAKQLDELIARIEPLGKASDAAPLAEELEQIGASLDVLGEIVNNLKIDDATQRTAILDALSEVYAHLNRGKAILASRKQELFKKESSAEFASQVKLLAQNLANYLSLCNTPEKCDELLTRLLVQIEELEARFAEAGDYALKIAEKREEAGNAFHARKQALLDERRRKAQGLGEAAERILQGVLRRALGFKDPDELNGYFASDPMVRKVREQLEQLRELGDRVKADDLEGRLKSARQDAGRNLRDKLEIFEDGENIIRFGEHRFTVNTQPLDLGLVVRDGGMTFHLTGTDYYRRVEDEDFAATQRFWNQTLPSEHADVYRAAYLAWKMFAAAECDSARMAKFEREQANLLDEVRAFAQDRYDEGYERGIHDHDAARILAELLAARAQCGLLRFHPAARTLAALFWTRYENAERKALLQRQAKSLGRVREQAPASAGTLIAHFAGELRVFIQTTGLDAERYPAGEAAAYLFEELAREPSSGFAVSQDALDLQAAFLDQLGTRGEKAGFLADLEALAPHPKEAVALARAWLDAFAGAQPRPGAAEAAEEVLGLLLTEGTLPRAPVGASVLRKVSGLLGRHPLIKGGALTFRFDVFLRTMERFEREEVPQYRAYVELRKRLVAREREAMRLEDFAARTLSSFVRNRLIDQVYLPLIGANLSKQIGEAGDDKRTDLMGLLLLISPPGYGKTTLMEYLAQRLGLIFMKINGPALGHQVTMLDPQSAPDATSRQELEKLNLAFEMGNNVMIYLDDIQHLNPEFLQKFISLCDAQRKIEGVFRGRSRTYDLRGKRVVVVMAGNPYTESGARFRIPDMLANRADTYNLGDILGGRQDLFELSFLENALTSNAMLRPLAARDPKDFHKLIEMADGTEVQETELSHAYSAAELRDLLEVIRRMRRVQKTVLAVNREYIRSAAMSDEFRTEPAFKLQGSYRDMNKMAARTLPVTSDAELHRIVLDHYTSEAQTLTTGAEHNLLKLGELLGTHRDDEAKRWAEIKRTFQRRQQLFGLDADDKVAHVVAQLSSFNENLGRIRETIGAATAKNGKEAAEEKMAQALAGLQLAIAEIAKTRQFDAQALEKALAQSTGKRTDPEPAKIEIVNTLPKYYGNLYKHHIDVIEAVLLPLVRGMQQQMGETKESQTRLAEMAEMLKTLLGKHRRLERRGETSAIEEDGEVQVTSEK